MPAILLQMRGMYLPTCFPKSLLVRWRTFQVRVSVAGRDSGFWGTRLPSYTDLYVHRVHGGLNVGVDTRGSRFPSLLIYRRPMFLALLENVAIWSSISTKSTINGFLRRTQHLHLASNRVSSLGCSCRLRYSPENPT